SRFTFLALLAGFLRVAPARIHAFTHSRFASPGPRAAPAWRVPETALSHYHRAGAAHPVRSRHRGASSPPATPSIRSFSSRASTAADANSLRRPIQSGACLARRHSLSSFVVDPPHSLPGLLTHDRLRLSPGPRLERHRLEPRPASARR